MIKGGSHDDENGGIEISAEPCRSPVRFGAGRMLCHAYTPAGLLSAGRERIPGQAARRGCAVDKQTTPVTWLAWDGKFTLEFYPREDPKTRRRQNWPFAEKEELIESTTTGAIQSVTKTVRADADKGAYHFKVHLTDENGKPYDDWDCPPIIIQAPVPSP